jgi:hypothetical protein
MPSKGNPIIKTRVSPLILAAMQERIDSRNETTNEKPWDVSDYLRYCVMCDLKHREASKRAGAKKRKVKA